MFQKIEVSRIRLADRVYEQILQAINQGYIGPADRIVQEKLAEELVVSRTPVREALLRLEQEGILRSVDRGGFAIRQTTPREIAELYQAREAIEGYCCAALARQAGAGELVALEEVIRQVEATTPVDVAAYYTANRQIHRAFVATTGNHHLLEMFDAMWNRSLSFQAFRLMKPAQLDLTLTGHLGLLDPIRSGDPVAANRAMIAHIQQGMQLQLSALDAVTPPED